MRIFFAKIRPYWYTVAVALALAITVTVVYIYGAAVPVFSTDASATEPESPHPDLIAAESPAPDAEPSLPAVPEPVQGPPYGFTGFSYNGAVSENDPVDDEWFSDAVFLGDSRTDGFRLHCGLTNSHIFGEKSISVFNIQSEKSIRLEDGSYGTLLDAAAARPYKKVYIMLGVNELGYRAEDYGEKYAQLVAELQELQPKATIYVQAVIPVTESKASGSDVYNNENIQAFNRQLAEVCEKAGVCYIDTYTAFADENGALPEALSWDGVHLTPEGYAAWLDYLRTHI